MTAAYEECLRALKLVNQADPVTQLLAKYIIEVAQTAERDSSRICALTRERLDIEYGRTPVVVRRPLRMMPRGSNG